MKKNKLIIILVLASIVFISGCTQSGGDSTTKEIKAQTTLTIETYCISTGGPPPCPSGEAEATRTPTPTETLPPSLPSSAPTATTSAPPVLPSATATTTLPPSLPSASATPTSDCTVTYTPPPPWQYGSCTNGQKALITKVTFTYKGKDCKLSEITPKSSESCTTDPVLTSTPAANASSSPTPTSTDVNPTSSATPTASAAPCTKQVDGCTHNPTQYKYACSGNTLTKYFCDKYWTEGDPCYHQTYFKQDTTSTCNFGCTAGQASSNTASPGIIYCQDKCEETDASTVKVWAGKVGNFDLTNSGYCESSYDPALYGDSYTHYKHTKYACLKQYSSNPSEGDGTLYQKTITDCGAAKSCNSCDTVTGCKPQCNS